MNTHDLKTWPEPFAALWSGAKRAEFRKTDRPFAAGDLLRLREWSPVERDRWVAAWTGRGLPHVEDAANARAYTGRSILARVTDITTGFGIPQGYAMLSIEEVERHEYE